MAIIAILLGLLPGFVWMLFYLREDVNPEPKKIIAKVFLAGAAVTAAILAFQYLFQELFKALFIQNYTFVPIAVFAGIEEVFKFLAAYFIIRRSRFFDEPIDAMIYMIVAALGVATIENILVSFNIIFQNGAAGGRELEKVISVITLRFLGATLLHTLSSGTVGYTWAIGMMRKRVGLWVFLGLVNAIALHSFFNYLILIFNKEVLIFPTIFLIIIAFFTFYDFEKLKSNREYTN